MDERATLPHTPDLREHFSRKAFPGFEVTQSPFLSVNGKFYAVVGQHVIRSSPLVTSYNVMDEEGNVASHTTAEKVYSYVAMTHITKFMSEKRSQLLNAHTRQNKGRDTEEADQLIEETLILKYKSEHGVNITDLLEENNHMIHMFERMEAAQLALWEMDYWPEDAFQEFLQAWEAFWKVYQKRLSQLFHFYSFCNEFGSFQDILAGTRLENIYREAKEMVDLFTKSIPEEVPFIEDVHDFISLMAQLGHVPLNVHEGELFNRPGALLRLLLQRVAKVFLWGIVPVTVLLFFINIVSYSSMAGAVFITAGCFVGELLVRDYLKKSVEKYISEERINSLSEQPIVRTKYHKAYTELQQSKSSQEKKEETDEFPASYTRLAYWLMVAGSVIIAFGFVVNEATGEYLITYINIGGIVFLIGMMVRILFRGIVYLSPEKLAFKRMKFPVDSISSTWTNRSGRKVFIRLKESYHRPIVLKVPREYRKEAKLALKKWCMENNIANYDE